MVDSQKSGFLWYELMTNDLDKAMGFYGSVVGWQVRDSGMPGIRYMIFGRDGKDVGGMMSWSGLGMSNPTTWKGHIFARDVDAETAAVVADGGKEHRPPQDIPGVGRFSVVADPQGVEYLLFQPNQMETPPRLGMKEQGSVGWHELATKDWERAWDFYSRHYGWTKQVAVPMGSEMGTYQTFMLNDEQGGGMMSIPASMADRMHSAWLFYFTVEAINAAAQRVKDAGGTVTQGPSQVPGGAWILRAMDNQAGEFALTAER